MAGPPPFSWTAGGVHPDVLVGVGLLAGAYVGACLARGRPVDRPRAGAFLGGLVAVALALNGPLHDLSDYYLFSAHMVQHLILTLVVPPLLLLGTPAWMIDGLLAPLLARRLPAVVVRTVVRPVPALVLHAVALIVWHLPAAYEAVLASHGWHIVQHLLLMATATLAWWPVLSPSRAAPALAYGAQILYLFVFGMPMTVVAAMITGAEQILYPFYEAAPRVSSLSPLADQRLGGVIMWVPAGVVPLIAFTVVFFRWAAAEGEEMDGPPGDRPVAFSK
ncbi:MAG: cytochrome c oxidase assembly protein [Candidatus Rokuibacteriota bacterium]